VEGAEVCDDEAGADVVVVEFVRALFLCEAKHHLETVLRLLGSVFWWVLEVFHSFREKKLESFVDLPLVESTG
jgi:hypothetical protein